MAKNTPTFSSSGFDKQAAETTTAHCDKGQPIYSQDDAADAIFRVEDGSVKLSVALDGKRAVIAVQAGGFRRLQEGQQVEFDLVKGPKGWQAENVKLAS